MNTRILELAARDCNEAYKLFHKAVRDAKSPAQLPCYQCFSRELDQIRERAVEEFNRQIVNERLDVIIRKVGA